MMPKNSSSKTTITTTDREIIATRVYDAPRERIFQVWTDPQHLSQWWGPRGFVTTTFKMDFRPGGVWRFVMHGPDGTDYQNKITYVEIDAPKRLVYQHGDDKETEPVNFKVTVTFDDLGDGRTKLDMRMVFPSAAAKNFVVEKYGAVEGLEQHVNRLGEHLGQQSLPDRPFVISRTFDAPRELVWKAWTERERMMKWFGPKAFTIDHATQDFRPGGTFHYRMVSPDGKEMWGKWTYREIIPPQRIVWVNSFSDEKGDLGRHPFAPEWPQEMLSTVTFAEYEGKTTITMQWYPINATADERKTFDTGRESMKMGWTGTMDRLADYLAEG
jgi:uncharacterized protein YndB with AHSA1/START domain